MPPINVGDKTFNTKVDAEAFIRVVLEENRPVNSSTRKIGDEYTKFIDDLLDLHPHKDIVVGTGVKAYYCQVCNGDAIRFLVERTDGTKWDFSWRNCLNPPTQAKRLTAVLRFEIQDQIDEFKRSIIFPVQCQISMDIIHASTCHIDHAEPNTFASLTKDWLKTTGYSPDSIELLHKDKYGGRSSIKSRAIAQQWKNYHKANANLRAVSVRANLSLLRRGK